MRALRLREDRWRRRVGAAPQQKPLTCRSSSCRNELTVVQISASRHPRRLCVPRLDPLVRWRFRPRAQGVEDLLELLDDSFVRTLPRDHGPTRSPSPPWLQFRRSRVPPLRATPSAWHWLLVISGGDLDLAGGISGGEPSWGHLRW